MKSPLALRLVAGCPWLVAAALGVVACGGSDTPVYPPPAPTAPGPGKPPPPSNEPPLEKAPARVEVIAPDAKRARDQAEQQLATRILGDARWLQIVSVTVFDPQRDSANVQPVPDGQTKVSLGLERARVVEILKSFETAPLRLTVPGAWLPTLTAFVTAHRTNQVCSRRQALLEEQCLLQDTSEVDRRAAELVQGLRLEGQPSLGIPVDAGGRLLRPVAVRLVSGSTPVAGAQLVLTTQEAGSFQALQTQTGGDGVGSFSLVEGASLPIDIAVRVDKERMLGALADRLPEQKVALVPRPVSMSRWSALLTEHAAGRKVNDKMVERALTRALESRGTERRVSLPQAAQLALGRAKGTQRSQRLPRLADELQGKVDVLLVVEAESEYASRMGANRVWFEARGECTVYELWTGRELGSVKATVTADGIGDQRADRAAREKLGQALVEKLAAKAELPWPKP